MTRSAIYSGFIVCLFLSVLFSQNPPDWVEKIPDDEKYYWARVSVGIKGLTEDEYKSKADNQALNTISKSISATVSGQSRSSFEETMTETDDSIKDIYEEESSIATIADIQGAERRDEYLTSTSYWVLWRLEKSVHAKNMEKFVEAAKEQYEGFNEWPQDDPVGQLQYLIPAYEAIIKVAGVPALFKGKNLRTEIPNKISKILNSIRLLADGENELTGQTGYALGKPLKVRVKAGKGMGVADIPIIFMVESGELIFSEETAITSPAGKASTRVTNILSRRSVQQVRAMIDLKEWREDRLSELVSFEKRLYDMTRKNSVLFTLDVKQVTQEKIAVITVGDTSVYNEDDLKRINSSFRSEFADVTDFKLKDEMLVEPIIESYKRSASLCSNEECQIEIGKKLGVERLVFVDIANYKKQTSVTIFLRNIAENELELQYGYEFPHKEWKKRPPEKSKAYKRAMAKLRTAEKDLEKADITLERYDEILNETDPIIEKYQNALDEYLIDFQPFKDDMIYDIEDNISNMVEDFWVRTNPGRLTLTCRSRGVKGNFEYLGNNKWFEKKFEKRLPIRDERFLEGTYTLNVNKLGYEKYHMRFDVAMGEFPVHEVKLIPKRPGKAFLRSLLIPGRGQIYSADEENRGRYITGLTYFLSFAALSGASGYLWNDFTDAKSVYETAKLDYNNAVDIEEVTTTQSIMLSAHSTMSDKRSTAMTVTILTGTMWLWNAIDAYLFFPSEYRGARLSLRASPQILAGEIGARTNLTWNF